MYSLFVHCIITLHIRAPYLIIIFFLQSRQSLLPHRSHSHALAKQIRISSQGCRALRRACAFPWSLCSGPDGVSSVRIRLFLYDSSTAMKISNISVNPLSLCAVRITLTYVWTTEPFLSFSISFFVYLSL